MNNKTLLALLTLLTFACVSPKKKELDTKSRQLKIITSPINDSLNSVVIKSSDGGFFSPSKKTTIGFSSDNSKKQFIQFVLDSNSVSISSLRPTSPWGIQFQKNSVNKLFAIHQFSFEVGEEKFNTVANTDFVGPYIVRNTDEDSTTNPKFTGGWHGSNGDATGVPTARNISWRVWDRKANPLSEDTLVKFSKKLWIEVVNHIQAYNSTAEVIKETVHYGVHPLGIDVFIEIEALATIEIERYYGIQSKNAIYFEELTYHFEDGSSKKEKSKSSSQSNDTLNENRVTHLSLSNEKQPFKMVVWINPFTKLYQGENLTTDKPWAFTFNYGKSYFNLINGKHLQLKKGEVINLSGGYYFLENNIVHDKN